MNKNNTKKDFKTPEGYFEGFTDRLLDKMSNENDELAETILPKNDGFKTPEGYFDSLNKTVLDNVNKKPGKVIALISNTKFYYYAAAAVAALLLLTIGIRSSNTVEPTFEGLAKAEIEAYFDSNELGLSTFEIAEVIPVDDLEITDILDNQLQEENIIDYLDDNVEEIEDLNLTDYEY